MQKPLICNHHFTNKQTIDEKYAKHIHCIDQAVLRDKNKSLYSYNFAVGTNKQTKKKLQHKIFSLHKHRWWVATLYL